jgi:hypothetical protein
MEASNITTPAPASSDEAVTSQFANMDINEVSAHQCANCTKPAPNRCSGCIGGLDKRGKERQISYCSKECQREHWVAGHKVECRFAMDRRQLFRIGALLQWTFYSNREHVWHDDTKKVHRGDERETGQLVVQLDSHGEGSFTKFPAELFPEEREKRAVLVGGASKSAVASMGELLARLARGSDSPTSFHVLELTSVGLKSKVEIHEVKIITARPAARHKFIFVPLEATVHKDYETHHLFSVGIYGDQMWALDLCIAQYCSTTPLEHECGVFPYIDYTMRLQSTIPEDLISIRPLLTNKFEAVDLNHIGSPPTEILGRYTLDRLHAMAEMFAISANETIIERFPVKITYTWHQLASLPQADYDRAVASFKKGYDNFLTAISKEMFY